MFRFKRIPDPETFRLMHLQTLRGAERLQDLSYTYDPVGNITDIRDNAQQTVFFNNTAIAASNAYAYDPLYRLIRAKGREHAAQNNTQRDAKSFEPIIGIPFPNSPEALQRYTEDYEYDPVGNIMGLYHTGGAIERWTRRYQYAPDSNRLLATRLPGDPDNLPDYTATPGYTSKYSYDTHGNMTAMLHLKAMEWDFKDQLRASQQQVNNGGTGEKTWYVYDASGQRVRKLTETQNGKPKAERIYLGGYEVYRKYNGNGQTVTLERETLHVMDDKQRVALIETRTRPQGADPAPRQLVRYQLGNHLGSAALELNNQAQVLSYEEYHPYGTTAYEAARSQTETPKRYRYTGKERDEETGFSYHGARYYAGWLGRWTSCDPIGIADGPNAYMYVSDNPARLIDPKGLAGLKFVSGGATAESTEADLMSATYDMASRTKKDLQDYFGIATDMSHTTAKLDEKGGCDSGTPGYKEIRLTLSDPQAQAKAKEALKTRLTESVKNSNPTLSVADISKLVDEKLKKTETVRNYLLESLKGDITITTKTTLKGGKTLIGLATEGVAVGPEGITKDPYIIANPYTFFVKDSGHLTDAIQSSSSRAKAALSPGLQLLHELVHKQQKFISGKPFADVDRLTVGKGAFVEEVEVTSDVDKALEGLDALVAPRRWYGNGKTIFNGREVTVNQGTPGSTYVLDPNGENYDLSYKDLTGKEWIRWPTESQLRTGKK